MAARLYHWMALSGSLRVPPPSSLPISQHTAVRYAAAAWPSLAADWYSVKASLLSGSDPNMPRPRQSAMKNMAPGFCALASFLRIFCASSE